MDGENCSEQAPKAHVFVGVLDRKKPHDDAMANQLGLAVIAGLPILLIVIDPTPVSPHLQQIAAEIFVLPSNDTRDLEDMKLQVATDYLMRTGGKW